MNDENRKRVPCRNCGAEIVFIQTKKSGKWVPCQPDIRKLHTLDDKQGMFTADGSYWTNRGQDHDGVAGFIPHFDFCPALQKKVAKEPAVKIPDEQTHIDEDDIPF